MIKIGKIISHNKIYTAMTVFIILINILIFAGKSAEKEARIKEEATTGEVTEEAQPRKAVVFDQDEIEEREKKVKSLAKKNPRLYFFLIMLNLLIFFLLFVGILLDGYFLGRFLRRKPLALGKIETELPRWGIPDVVRVAVIFFFFGYVFIIFQAFAVRLIPIFNNDNFRMVFNTTIMNLVGISVIVYFIVKKHGQKIDAVGLTTKHFLRNSLYAVIGYIALIPVIIGIMVATYFVIKKFQYHPPVQPIVEVFMKEKQSSILLLSTLFAAIFGPVAEEIFFRGFVYGAIRKTIGVFWGMVITAGVFALLHAHIVGFLPIMALGLLLVYLYEKTGSLVPSILVHVIHNLGMLFLVFTMRGVGV